MAEATGVTQDFITLSETKINALEALRDATTRSIKAKGLLARTLALKRYEGVIEGKNEGDREAHARVLLDNLYQEVEDAEVDLAIARTDVEIAETGIQATAVALKIAERFEASDAA